MSARDELAAAICTALDEVSASPAVTPMATDYVVADGILAAGYRKPHEVSTAKELDALRFESVVIDAHDTPYVCERHRTDGTHNEWRMSGHDYLMDSEDVLIHAPITVVWEPQP